MRLGIYSICCESVSPERFLVSYPHITTCNGITLASESVLECWWLRRAHFLQKYLWLSKKPLFPRPTFQMPTWLLWVVPSPPGKHCLKLGCLQIPWVERVQNMADVSKMLTGAYLGTLPPGQLIQLNSSLPPDDLKESKGGDQVKSINGPILHCWPGSLKSSLGRDSLTFTQ